MWNSPAPSIKGSNVLSRKSSISRQSISMLSEQDINKPRI